MIVSLLAFVLGVPGSAQDTPKPIVMQTVEIMDQSTEGGEASLTLVGDPKLPVCRIDATYYGETGKSAFTFMFDRELKSAVRQDFGYDRPIYEDPKAKARLAKAIDLSSEEGRANLPTFFAEHRARFDEAHLARCGK